jgi:hypothetical protein
MQRFGADGNAAAADAEEDIVKIPTAFDRRS